MIKSWPQGKIIQHNTRPDIAFYVAEAEEVADGSLYLSGTWLNVGKNNTYTKRQGDDFYVDREYLIEAYDILPDPKMVGSEVLVSNHKLKEKNYRGKVLGQKENGMLRVSFGIIEEDQEIHWTNCIVEK